MAGIDEYAQGVAQATTQSLERTTEADFFFLVGSLVFGLDAALTLVTGKNLPSIESGLRAASFDWGKTLVFVLAYSFAMAIALKTMRHMIEEFISSPIIALAVRLSPSTRRNGQAIASGSTPVSETHNWPSPC